MDRSRRTVARTILGAFAVLLLLAFGGAAAANPYAPRSPAGFASPDAVTEAVGERQQEVICPEQRVENLDEAISRTGPHAQRGIKVTISKPGTGYRDVAVMDTILLNALQTAWQGCSIVVANPDGDRSEVIDVPFVDIYGRLSDGTPPMRLVHAHNYFGLWGYWEKITDEGADYEKQIAEAQAQQVREQEAAVAAQQRAAEQEARQQSEAVRQQQIAEQTAANNAAAGRFWASLWSFIKRVFFAIAAWIVWSYRLSILRLYYSLTPHPAAGEISRVVDFGATYNPDRLAEVLRQVPGNPMEREVRARQAADLLEKLNAHARHTKAELEEEAAYLNTHAGLMEGMEMQARIKRRLEGIMRAKGKMG